MKLLDQWSSYFEKNDKKFHYYVVYTVAFWLVALAVFWWFLLADRSLIWQHDGWNQHFRALLYYSDALKQFFKNLFVHHRLVLPQWHFSIGEGSDILNTLHYYVIGDPIAFLSVFVPARFMHYFYSFASVLRMYLAGAAFSALAMDTGSRNRYGVLAGALSYAFCFWALQSAARHPYFLNPLIYFPLVILGVEKIIRGERPYWFVGMVAVSAASNFYFFYMIALLTAIYALVRLGFLYRRDIRRIAGMVLKIGLLALLGMCIAGMIFFPVVMMVLQDARMSIQQPFFLFYPLAYYTSLPAMILSSKTMYWACLGFSAPVLLAWFVLFLQRKKNTLLKVLFAIGAAIFLFPICGRILNGMSYMSNRWSWAFALLSAYILTREWDELVALSRADWIKTLLCCAGYLAVCMLLEHSRTTAALTAIAMLLICLLVFRQGLVFRRSAMRQIMVVLLTCVSIANVALWKYSPYGENYAAEGKANSLIETELKNDEAMIVKALSDENFTRYSGRKMEENVNLTHDISSTQYFWTLSNPYVAKYRMQMELPDSTSYSYSGYDDRTALLALSSTPYYVTKRGDDEGLPYGYELLEHSFAPVEAREGVSRTEYSIYQNSYALPLGYCYDSYFTKEAWEGLDPIQKQEVQMESACVDRAPDMMEAYDVDMMDYTLPYEVECLSDDVCQTDTGFVTTVENAKVRLTFEGMPHSETYLRIRNLEVQETTEYALYSDDDAVDPLHRYNHADWEALSPQRQKAIRKASWFRNGPEAMHFIFESDVNKVKDLEYIPAGAAFSSGRKDFVINLGYWEEPNTSITVTFPKRGVYTIDALEVYNVPMDDYDIKIENLQMSTLQDVKFGIDCVSGELECEWPQLLCMAIPYSKGWKALVDGEETDVLLVNERYLGVAVAEGRHEIVFTYQMPYGKAGIALSLTGVMGLLLLAVLTEKAAAERRRNTEKLSEA